MYRQEEVIRYGHGREWKKPGDVVRAGEPVIKVDMDEVKSAGCSMQTFTVITEANDDDKITFITSGNVKSGQKVNA